MADLLADIAAEADELTNPMLIVERVWTTNAHRHKRLRKLWTVSLPSLLDQLAEAVVPGESYVADEANTRSAFASRPAARLDAVDRLLAIQAGAATWCTQLGLTLREHAAGNIRALVGASPTAGSDTQRLLKADLRSWRIWAATVTGWERPPHVPRAPCLACEQRGSLRIRLEQSTACCMACGATWDQASIGVLTAHITAYRSRSDRERDKARAAAVVHRRELRVVHEPKPDLPYLTW